MTLLPWLDRTGQRRAAHWSAPLFAALFSPCCLAQGWFDNSRVNLVAMLSVLAFGLLLVAALIYRRQLVALRARTHALETSEDRYRLIVEGTNVVAWEYDLETQRFTYVSTPGEALLGFPLDDWMRPGFWRERLHPEDVARAIEFLRSQLPGESHESEYRLLHADGKTVHVRDLRAHVMQAGRVVGMRGIFVDISAHRTSEAALEDSEARQRSAFEQAAVGMSLCSITGHILRVNLRYCEITGFSEAELLRRDFREITHPEDVEGNERLLDLLVLGSDKKFSMEKRLLRASGEYVWVNLTLSMVKTRRLGITQFMEVIEDVTARKHAEAELRENEGRMRLILAAMHEGVVMRDASGQVIIANAAARRTYGLGPGETFPPLYDPMGLRYFHEDGSPCPIDELPGARAMRSGRSASAVVGVERRDGSLIWFVARAEPLLRDDRTGLHPVVFTMTDITAQRRAEAELRLAATVFDNSVEAIMISDAHQRILSVNRAFSELTGFDAGEAIGQPPSLLASARTSDTHLPGIWQSAQEQGLWQGESWLRRRDGSEFPGWLSISTVRDRSGALQNFVTVFSDITERKANEARIAFLAHHDPLTSLPNRTLFQDRLEQALARAERNQQMVAMMFLDLDRFKNINDSLGHLAGDRLLQSVAQRLAHCVRETDTICRQGGDEFLIVLADLSDADVPARIAEKILRRLAEPIEVDGHALGTSFSIGISVYPNDGRDSESLMKNADTAMYHAKEGGRNTYRFFTEQMNANALERLQLENHLRRALDHSELLLNYQPQIDLVTGQVVCVEALIRWQSDVLGFVPPARFVPISEESGLIVAIGRWVMRQACVHARAWQEAGFRGIAVAVNISALQFRRDDIVMLVHDVLTETGLAPELLELEITESLIMQHADDVLDTLRRLKSLGVRLSIDDFGTGYSSLSYLKRFAVDRLKIDQSFVRDIVEDPDDAAIVRAIIQMGRSLKLDVVAEGAESRAQVDFLIREGCRVAQGYFFCPPVTHDVLGRVLAQGVGARVDEIKQAAALQNG